MKYFACEGEGRRLDAVSRATLRGSYIKLSDGITHYELSGPDNGDVVVLVGGLTVPLFYWDQAVSMLHQEGLRTLAYSGYGRGYSDRIRIVNYNDVLFVRQLTELIKALDIGRYHILGASMGALVAMAHVCQNVGSVATLTVAGPAGLLSKPGALRWLQRSDQLATFIAKNFGHRWLKRHEANDLSDRTNADALSKMLRDAYQYEGSIHAIFDTLQNFSLFNRESLYQSVAETGVPSMLIWGQDDRVTPIDKINVARNLLQPVECCVVECGHMVPFERPGVIARKMKSFIQQKELRIVS